VLGDRLFFTAYDPEHGWELWVSDGTPEGTMPLLLGDTPGSVGPDPQDLTVLGDRLFFTADDGLHGQELWVSDGTPEGTAIVKGIPDSVPSSFTVLGDRLFFRAYDPEHGRELWVSDGTPEGTGLFKDFIPGPGGFGGVALKVVGDRLFVSFYEDRNCLGRPLRSPLDGQLWVSDGTPEGTVSASPGTRRLVDAYALGDRLFFSADDLEHGNELWISDGTPEGTMLVKDIVPGNYGSDPQELTVLGDRLFFAAQDPEHGRELWVLPLDGIPPLFTRGEANADGALDISDPLTTLRFLFQGSAPLRCFDAADADDDGKLDLSDAVYALQYLFRGSQAPPAPFPRCGPDPTADALGCTEIPGC